MRIPSGSSKNAADPTKSRFATLLTYKQKDLLLRWMVLPFIGMSAWSDHVTGREEEEGQGVLSVFGTMLCCVQFGGWIGGRGGGGGRRERGGEDTLQQCRDSQPLLRVSDPQLSNSGTLISPVWGPFCPLGLSDGTRPPPPLWGLSGPGWLE